MKTTLLSTAAAILLASVWSSSSFAQRYDDEDHGGAAIITGETTTGNRAGTMKKTETNHATLGSMMSDRSRRMGLMNGMMTFRRGGARFQFSKGDAHIDIRCPQNETLQNCVDAASRLIDKVHSLEPGPAEQGTAH